MPPDGGVEQMPAAVGAMPPASGHMCVVFIIAVIVVIVIIVIVAVWC